mgnify:CR=1 FL=1
MRWSMHCSICAIVTTLMTSGTANLSLLPGKVYLCLFFKRNAHIELFSYYVRVELESYNIDELLQLLVAWIWSEPSITGDNNISCVIIRRNSQTFALGPRGKIAYFCKTFLLQNFYCMYMVQWILFERFKDMIRFLAQSFREKRIANFFDPQVNLLQWMDDDLLIQIGNYLTRIVNHENYADLFKKCDIPRAGSE